MKSLFLLPLVFLSCSAIDCYVGYSVYGQPARHNDLHLKTCPGKNDCCGVVWQWYGGSFDCFSSFQAKCPRPLAENGEACIGAWNGFGWDGQSTAHWCACKGTVGHCMPDFPDRK